MPTLYATATLTPRITRLSALKDRARQAYNVLDTRRVWTNSQRRATELAARADVARGRWHRLGDALRAEERGVAL